MPASPLPTNSGSVEQTGPEDTATLASGLIHRVQLPPNAGPAQPTPAVVMVHGWGGDESVMWIFKQAVPAGVAIITPRAPLSLEQGGYTWYERDSSGIQPDPASIEAGVARLEHFLTSLPQLYPLDPTRFLLIGFSQGAATINSLVLTRPYRAIGVASLAGLVPDWIEPPVQADWLAGLPVFIAHGTRDEIIPVNEAHQTRERYTQAGAQVTYHEDHTGHKLSVRGIKDLKNWLAGVIFNQSRTD